MKHSLHLAAKHFVQTVALHHTKHNASAGDDEGDSASDSGKNNDHDNEPVDVGDSLRKAIALVKQVSHSTALLVFCTNTCDRFVSQLKLRRSSVQHATCAQVGITLLELLLWIHTRWGLLFSFLKCFIKLKAVCLLYLSKLKVRSYL